MAATRLRESAWRPDLPDPRDYTPEHERVVPLLGRLDSMDELPGEVDWRGHFAAPEAEERLVAGPAAACAALVQYFERRAHGRRIHPSRRFLFYTARRLMCAPPEAVPNLRACLEAVVRFGLPEEAFWPDESPSVHCEPDAFVYTLATRFPDLCYVRLDGRGQPPGVTLAAVKSFLAAGFPSVFGFSAFTSTTDDGQIAYPTIFDDVCGSETALALGYHDRRVVRSDRGALLIRPSGSRSCTRHGHAWLPYRYITEQLAADFWTLLNPEWLANGEFGRPV